MNYGFVIDNRKCIGCHACTVACKSEHDVAIGVNRTHVKYIEKGVFPDASRSFSVHRCNHCEDAPCTTICPTSALHTRMDGIVDFDNDRCIGCKSCMQACPYDALYIDPDTNTAAKCNYCAHRVDTGYEPACVVICPTEAIISGDLDDAHSKIASFVAMEHVVTRKPEKGTTPNLYYIEGDSDMLTPSNAERRDNYIWSEQASGVGHHAPAAATTERTESQADLLVQMAIESHAKNGTQPDQRAIDKVLEEIKAEEQSATRRVYDSPAKGVLWGWEVPAYIWTKSVATGLLLVLALTSWFGAAADSTLEFNGYMAAIVFMMLTGGLLVKDLDRPDRFLYVLLRPNWSSWLVRGGYLITVFGAIITALMADNFFDLGFRTLLINLTAPVALLTAIYTAFLLAQAKGRDLWGSHLAPVHMLIHALIAGSAGWLFLGGVDSILTLLILKLAVLVNLALIGLEFITPHATSDTKRAHHLMISGFYSRHFMLGIIMGNLVPLIMLFTLDTELMLLIAAGLSAAGIFITEFVRVRVPQLIPLS
ncbi:MAG: polysulfide reductase NrfD [Candidatus Marinimicrobia bacterium]|jgi:Fe-S-cluster-containing dehydrogenase component/formate-dependent nitrite reductase membrane component NrfD|nr:polysulfide reductase NrfD [Candidatus Neomarinimicrobiota bacterium]MBT3575476.1 polysulfide reductase NrfD [Candidatus Neomarinimicrobiota bacterium]MBT3679573.1 polysulfide reductase NrfD [Candidatus Neomarinimicrobiota bacterium]MBT3950530.1 polysulfide reductase NrfD [Candidatus Neomarinimicrobiota bacterium]MBT4253483.1 polysulfide reductase NrfD [Candidatus Neomarinimicrobiota bacterium]